MTILVVALFCLVLVLGVIVNTLLDEYARADEQVKLLENRCGLSDAEINDRSGKHSLGNRLVSVLSVLRFQGTMTTSGLPPAPTPTEKKSSRQPRTRFERLR